MKRLRIGFVAAASAWALLGHGPARAQMAPAPAMSQGSAMPPAAMLANPYLNPYLNPYMNPMATQQPMSGTNALMYLYAANSANGGLGSGRISGTRGGATASSGRAKVAEMPNSLSHPGGGASRYFNPGQASGGAGRYYNQRGRYFQSNGR